MANLDLSKYGITDVKEILHNPSYDFNDAILPVGASIFARIAENYLS